MSGGSRGIGLAIAVRAARAGANVAIIAKTDAPDPRIPGTIHTAAQEIEAVGGHVLPIVGDIREEEVVKTAVASTVDRFGSLDVVVNNASAINLTGFGELESKRFGLLLDVNIRGTFHLITHALPHLLEAPQGQIMTLSPPLSTDRKWLAKHAPYTLSKFGMSMLTLGLHEQFSNARLSAYCLWPETYIATAAVQNIVAGDEGMRAARTPLIMADAAYELFVANRDEKSGRCHVDADVLRAAGKTDLADYAAVPGTPDSQLEKDLFL